MQAKVTAYKGVVFRSRHEARWAYFWDTVDVRWQYEPLKVRLTGVGGYLPDFWLPGLEYWAEVKPRVATADDGQKIATLIRQGGGRGLLLAGIPGDELITVYVKNIKKKWPGDAPLFWSSLLRCDRLDIARAYTAARTKKFDV